MDLRDELDEYAIPKRDRPKWLKWNILSGWVVAGIMFSVLLNCMMSRVSEQKEDKESAKLESKEYREFVKEQIRSDLKASAAPVLQDAKQYIRTVDTLKQKVDTINQKI